MRSFVDGEVLGGILWEGGGLGSGPYVDHPTQLCTLSSRDPWSCYTRSRVTLCSNTTDSVLEHREGMDMGRMKGGRGGGQEGGDGQINGWIVVNM